MSGELVTVRIYLDPTIAELDQARLAGSGIEASLPEQFTVQNGWQFINAVGGLRLQVKREDLATARQVLDEIPVTDESIELNPKEQVAEQMAKAVAVGLLIPPVQYYALWLLLKAQGMEGSLRPMVRRKYLLAAGLNVTLVVAVFGLLIVILFLR